MRAALALLAILTGPVVAVTHRPLSGWTILAALLIAAGGALLVEVTHPLVDVQP